MSIILGIILILVLYIGGTLLGYKLGAAPPVSKVALVLVGLSVAALIANFVAPAAFGRLGQVAMFILPLSLGFFRGSRRRASQLPADNGTGTQG